MLILSTEDFIEPKLVTFIKELSTKLSMIEVNYLEGNIKTSNNLNSINTKNRTWIDIINPSREDLNKIKRLFNIHNTIIEDCLVTGNRPKAEQVQNSLLVIIYTLNEDVTTKEICFILGKTFLVSLHRETIPIFERLKQDKEKLKDSIKLGMDFLLHKFLSNIIEDYFPVLEKLENELNELENKALKNPEPEVLEKLFKTKRKLLRIRKIIYPQREAINTLSISSHTVLPKESNLYFRDIYDDMLIITDLVEDFRETISSILEVHLSVTSNKLNEIMKVLTIISTIFIPMTLVASVYGMNFKYLPELEWRYGYYWAIGFMGLILILMLIYLKRKKWL